MKNLVPIALVLLAGCATMKSDMDPGGLPIVVQAQPLEQGCLAIPPPPLLVVHLDQANRGCPEKYGSCMSREDTLNLAHDMGELERYAREAWVRCGARSQTPVAAHPPASAPPTPAAHTPQYDSATGTYR